MRNSWKFVGFALRMISARTSARHPSGYKTHTPFVIRFLSTHIIIVSLSAPLAAAALFISLSLSLLGSFENRNQSEGKKGVFVVSQSRERSSGETIDKRRQFVRRDPVEKRDIITEQKRLFSLFVVYIKKRKESKPRPSQPGSAGLNICTGRNHGWRESVVLEEEGMTDRALKAMWTVIQIIG
jgi:hypothetical protein